MPLPRHTLPPVVQTSSKKPRNTSSSTQKLTSLQGVFDKKALDEWSSTHPHDYNLLAGRDYLPDIRNGNNRICKINKDSVTSLTKTNIAKAIHYDHLPLSEAYTGYPNINKKTVCSWARRYKGRIDSGVKDPILPDVGRPLCISPEKLEDLRVEGVKKNRSNQSPTQPSLLPAFVTASNQTTEEKKGVMGTKTTLSPKTVRSYMNQIAVPVKGRTITHARVNNGGDLRNHVAGDVSIRTCVKVDSRSSL